jgi:hypothetical protein
MPNGLQQAQAYVLENSVSFQQADQRNYRRWFTRGKQPTEFSPQQKVDLSGTPEYFGAIDQRTGETFAIMLLTPPLKAQLETQDHSGLLRATYPDFTIAGQAIHYQTAYYFGKQAPDVLEMLFRKIRAEIK